MSCQQTFVSRVEVIGLYMKIAPLPPVLWQAS